MKHRKIIAVLSALTLLAGSLSGINASAAAKGSGDIDENGSVQIADAILLARWIAEDTDITVTTQGLLNADMNGDEAVDSDDAAALLSWLAGTETAPPSEGRSVDLLADVQAGDVQKGNPADEAFRAAQAKFSVDLLREQQSLESDKEKNLLVSPLSVSLALGMTMNGAKGDTLTEMQKVLGDDLTAEQLNSYYAGWSDALLKPETVRYLDYDENGRMDTVESQSAPVTLANAIWIRDNEERIHVPLPFLRTTAGYYHADAFRAPFDETTVDDINGWCDENTHHMIPKVLNGLTEQDVMVLANALTFEDIWSKPYEDYQIDDGKFTAVNGKVRDVKMMSSEEGTYIQDDKATGFIKGYRDSRYSFAAVLPNEDVSLDDYIASLDGEKLQKLLASKERCEVWAEMPEFSYDYSTELNAALCGLGMPAAFSPGTADFTGLNDAEGMATWIGRVIHKTHIEVCKSGTKAAAVTVITMRASGVIEDPPQPKHVTLDRPFLFMILDNQTNLPLFLGTVKDIPAEQ